MNNAEIEQSAIERFGEPRKIEEISEEELLSVFPADILASFSRKRIIKTYKRAITLHMKGMMRILDDISDGELVEAVNNCFTIEGLQLKCRCLIEDRRRVARRLAKLDVQLETGLGASYEKHSFDEIREAWKTSSSYKEIFTKLDISSYKQAHILEERLQLSPLSSPFKPKNKRAIDDISDEILESLVSTSSSYREIAKRLGFSSSYPIRKHLIKRKIDIEHIEHRHVYMTLDKMHENTNLNSAQIIRMLEHLQGPLCCELCGQTHHNGKPLSLQVHHKNSIHTDNRIENIQILCPNCHNFIEEKGMYERYNKTKRKELIKKNGRKCNQCGIQVINGKPVPLQCHHKNGNRQDNSIENLELLCPNCHSQTENFTTKGKILRTYSKEDFIKALWNAKTINEALRAMGLSAYPHYYQKARAIASEFNIVLATPIKYNPITTEQIKHIKHLLESGCTHVEISRITNVPIYKITEIKKMLLQGNAISFPTVKQRKTTKKKPAHKSYDICPQCGRAMTHGSKTCIECSKKNRINIPLSKKELKALIRQESFEQIARNYNVTGNTIKKWCRYYHLPSKRSDIDAFTDEEWEQMQSYDSMSETKKEYDWQLIAEKYIELRSYQLTADFFGCSLDTVKKACVFNNVNLKPLTRFQMTSVTAIDVTDENVSFSFQTIPEAVKWIQTELNYNSTKETIENRLRDILVYNSRKSIYGFYWEKA